MICSGTFRKLRWMIGAVFLGFGTGANATTIFDFMGSCITNCSEFGASLGDPITGAVAVDDSAAGPGDTISAADVSAVSLSLGTLNFDFPTDPASLGLFFALVDGSGSGLSAIRFRGVIGGSLDVFFRFPDIIATTDTWRVAKCALGTNCIGENVLGAALGNRGAWVRAVPEATTILLLGLGLAGVGFARRRWH